MDYKFRVLVACPTFSGMDYCLDTFLNRIKNLSSSPYEILMVDNSDADLYYKKIVSKGINCIRDNISEENKLIRLVHSRNLILDYAAKNNFDYLLMMDQDVIPPVNILETLLSSKKDIISGVYLNYFISSKKTELLPVAWMPVTELEFEEMKSKGIKFNPSIKSHKDLNRHLTQKEFNTPQILKVLHPSAGCMLLSKKVFSKVKYESLDLRKMGFQISKNTTDDLGFRKNAQEQGFEIFIDTSVKCDHLVLGKYIRINNELIHPLSLKKEMV